MSPRLLPVAVVLLLPLASCSDGDRPFGRACQADGDCGALACIEGACAERYELPPGEPEEGPAGPVRVFAIGLGIDLEALDTAEGFDAFIRAKVDEEVVPHLSSERPNLLVFPENTGLLAALVGQRGANARSAPDSAAAFLELFEDHGAAIDHYRERTDAALPIGQAILLGVTDMLWRTLQRTFAALAEEHGVHVAVTYDVADAERTDALELAPVLVDESVSSPDHVYVAEGEAVYNQTIVYGPDGALLFAHHKEYLVPDEEDLLTLTYGAPGNVAADPLPFGDTASVISKDAWMPDVLDRLAQDGTRLMLQPEAFAGWGVPHGPEGSWGPDVVKESGWAHVQRFPEMRANAMACLNGNFFDMFWDCQSAIWVDGRVEAHGAFIGQDPDVGFARVAPWVVEDDGEGTLEERREELIEVGERLLPGSGDPLENAYATDTVWLDVDLDAPWPDATPDGVVAPTEAGAQRRPDVAALEDGSWVAVWEDTRDGPSRLFGARFDPAVGDFGAARPVAPDERGVRVPRLAAHGDTIHAVWVRRDGDARRVVYARSDDGGRSFPDPEPVAPVEDDAAHQHMPAVTVDAARGTVHVAFVERTATGALRIMHARRDDGSRGFEAPVPVETPPQTQSYNTRHNRWHPTVAAHDDRVAVAWASFRRFRWTIDGAVSDDGGQTFGMARTWDDADVPFETIHTDPELAATEDGWLLVWTDLRVRWPDHDARARHLPWDGDPTAAPPSVSLAVSDEAGRPQWAPSVGLSGSRALVAWQDLRNGRNAIHYATSDDEGRTFGADTAVPSAQAQWFSPRVAAGPDGAFTIVSECTAGGHRRICVHRVGAVP